MNDFTFDVELFSDLHKDAYGFRPSIGHEFYEASDERKQEIWDLTIEEVNESIKMERLSEAKAILNLIARICEMRSLGAETDADALRWVIDAEGMDGNDLRDGGFEYILGLPFCGHPFEELKKAVVL